MDRKNNTHKLKVGDLIEYNNEWPDSNQPVWEQGVVIRQLKERKHCFQVKWLSDGGTTMEISPLIIGNGFRVLSAPR